MTTTIKRTSDMKIKIKKLREDAVIPQYALPGDAGMDMFAVSESFDEYGNVVYGTGIALEIPEGYVGLVFPKSSLSKKNLALANAVGVIDSGYRGEVTFKFKPVDDFMPSDRKRDCSFEKGKAVGQLIVMPYPHIEFEETDALSETERGTGGYGSTDR